MRACGPEHLRASQTCYCLKLPRACRSRSPSKKFDCCKNNSKLFSRLRSRSLTELTRKITPPTKNGHAPPPIESRKSFQSVNPYYVRTWSHSLAATAIHPHVRHRHHHHHPPSST